MGRVISPLFELWAPTGHNWCRPILWFNDGFLLKRPWMFWPRKFRHLLPWRADGWTLTMMVFPNVSNNNRVVLGEYFSCAMLVFKRCTFQILQWFNELSRHGVRNLEWTVLKISKGLRDFCRFGTWNATKRRSRRKKALEREYALFAQKVKKSKSHFSRKKSKSNFSKKNSKSQKVTFRAKSQKVTFRKTTQKVKKSLFAQKVKK